MRSAKLSTRTLNPAGSIPRAATPPAAPTPPRDYAPGAIRSATDHEDALIAAFYRRHPEYEILPRALALQIAETYLDEDEHDERAALAAEGVPCAPYGFDDPTLSDIEGDE